MWKMRVRWSAWALAVCCCMLVQQHRNSFATSNSVSIPFTHRAPRNVDVNQFGPRRLCLRGGSAETASLSCVQPSEQMEPPSDEHCLENATQAANEPSDDDWSSGAGNPGCECVWIPDNMTNIPRALRKVYVEWPAPGPDGLINPPINQFGDPEVIESYEWEAGSGQKLRLRGGYYSWGLWSERLKRLKYPSTIAVAGPHHLDMQGVEEGVCLNGCWTFVNGTGFIRALTLMSRHHLAGRGGGLTLHFEGGNWTFERCRLAVTPGALTCVLAIAGDAHVALNQSIVTRTEGAEIGAQAYGMFVWNRASAYVLECCVWELKVAADVSYHAALKMEKCNVSFNRIGIMMHDDCNVTILNSTFLLNHRAAFEVGLHGKDRAHLTLRHVTLKGTRAWIDEGRPKELVEHNVTVDNTNVPLPTKHIATNFPIMDVPQTYNESMSRLLRDIHANRSEILWNMTALNHSAALNSVDFRFFGPL